MSTSSERRRRILNDGARTSDAGPTPAADSEPAGVSRYAANEKSASFAVARRVLPHRRRAIAGVVLAGMAGIAGLLAAHHYRAEIAAAVGLSAVRAIDLADTASIAGWTTIVGMTVLAGLCLLVYGLRRHRSDDLRGLYRWWLSASLAVVGCCLCVATGLHTSLAEVAAVKSGWLPLGGSTVWWVAPATLVLGAVAFRGLLDLKHCVPALMAAIVSLASGGTATAATLGYTPEAAAPWSTLIAHGGALLSLLAAITTLLCYSRRIVLEADGAINAPVQKPTPKPEKNIEKKSAAKPAPTAEKPVPKPRVAPATTPKQSKPAPVEVKKAKPPKPAASTTQWTDGSDGGDEYDEEGSRRKLSKAERKRLRKLKARQGRAA